MFSRAWNYLNVFSVLGIVSMFHKLVTNQIIYLSSSTFTFLNYLSLSGMNLMFMILDAVRRAQQFRERLSEKMCTRQSRKRGLHCSLLLLVSISAREHMSVASCAISNFVVEQ